MADGPDVLSAVAAPVLADLGLELVDVEVAGRGRTRAVRVFVDRPGGVDLDAITRATEALSPALDADPRVTAALPGPYTLEVSSPGLERPLRRPEQFARAVGSTISLKTRDADGSARRRRVVLLAADDDAIVVAAADAPDGRERIPFARVEAARTVFEWGPADKPGAGSRPGKARRRAPAVSSTRTTRSGSR